MYHEICIIVILADHRFKGRIQYHTITIVCRLHTIRQPFLVVEVHDTKLVHMTHYIS